MHIYLSIMKPTFSRQILLFATVCSGALCFAEDDLDAALAAKKKAPVRRVYSERAVLDNLDIMLPKNTASRDKEVDELLERKESRDLLDRQKMTPAPAVQNARVPMQKPSNKNWLTPAMMEESSAPEGILEAEQSWVELEMERQQSIRDREAAAIEEEKLVDQMLKDRQRQSFAVPSSSSNPYSRDLKKISQEPAFNSLNSRKVDDNPFNSIQSSRSTESRSSSSSLFGTGRKNSGVIQSTRSTASSFGTRASTPSTYQSQRTSSSLKTPSSSSALDWTANKTKTLTPLERVKQSSRINQRDPFVDDFSPRGNSQWD